MSATTAAPLPAADRAAIWSLIGVDVLARISYQVCRTPALPLFVASLGAAPTTVGFIGAASTLTGVVLKAPVGAMSDVIGRRRLLLLGLFVFALGPFLYTWSGPAWLVPVRLFHGLATAVYSPVAMAAVAALAGGRRGEYMSWLSNGKTCAALLGSLLGGAILASAGVGLAAAFNVRTDVAVPLPAAADFRTAWWVAGGLGIAALALCLVVTQRIPEPEPPKERQRLFAKLAGGMREVASDRSVLLVSGCEGVQNLTVGALEQFLPIYAVVVAGHSPLEAGAMFGVQTITTILSKPLFGRYSDVRGRKGLVVAGMFACALPFAAIPWCDGLWSLLGVALVFGLGEALVTAASAALVSDLCKRRRLGAAMGMLGTIGDVGHASGPLVTGLVIAFGAGSGRAAETLHGEPGPFRAAFGVVAAILVLYTVAFLVFDRTVETAAARAGTE